MSTLIGSYTWVDTRDLVADGLTKGRADRTPLVNIMSGAYILSHVCHEYKEPSTTTSGQYVQRGAAAAPLLRQPDAVLNHNENAEYLVYSTYKELEAEALDRKGGGDGSAVTAISPGQGTLNCTCVCVD